MSNKNVYLNKRGQGEDGGSGRHEGVRLHYHRTLMMEKKHRMVVRCWKDALGQ